MTLHQAYTRMREPTVPQAEKREAFEIIYGVLVDKAKRHARNDSEAQELASTVLLALVDAAVPIGGVEDAQVHAYLCRAMHNAFVDSRKRGNRDEELSPETEATDHQPQAIEEVEDRDQVAKESVLLRGVAGACERYREVLVAYLRNEVVTKFRSDAVKSMQEALDQMRRITEGETSFDRLVAEVVVVSGITRCKAQQLIHKRHSRTRERMLEVLRGSSELTEFDRRALEACVQTLRSRKEASEE